jgi:hypothetical protein
MVTGWWLTWSFPGIDAMPQPSSNAGGVRHRERMPPEASKWTCGLLLVPVLAGV